MRQLDELCNLIKSDPKSIAHLDWAEETAEFSNQRMHDIILGLDDIDQINSVVGMIQAEWNFLKSRNDPRCYEKSDNGQEKLKFPNSNDYLSEPLSYFVSHQVSLDSLSGVLFCCKQEALRKIIPQKEREELQAKILEKYSQPDERKEAERAVVTYLPDPVELRFFNKRPYITAEEQQCLREILQAELSQIDTSNGREWFAFYAAYRYVRGHIGMKKQYVDFFSDIEKLLPDALPLINPDEQGDKRYKHYTTQLSKEVENWYVDQGKLPKINTLDTSIHHIHCSEEVFRKTGLVIKTLYSKLYKLEKRLCEEKGIKMF